ncbi:MAG TPA: hypothetical protein VG841_04770 [Caulobacterales bacterium]|nr:hypothetical protein [Caulobacterales bacterium]
MRHSPEGRAASEIVRELRASGSLVETCLEHLTRAGLVAREGAEARYAPANERLRRLAEELERAYRQRPLAIINVVVHRGRVSPIQRFADAFRFREPKE